MPAFEDGGRLHQWTARSARNCEAARRDPCAPHLAEAMRALAAEFGGPRGTDPDNGPLDAGYLQVRAHAHAAAGEAWCALNYFDAAPSLPGRADHHASPGMSVFALARRARCKCPVDLQHPAEAFAEVNAWIQWYRAKGDPTQDEQQSLLRRALNTLGPAHADTGDHGRARQPGVLQ